MSYRFSPRADRDLQQIWLWIARDSLSSADEVEAAILRNCEMLASFPGSGRERPDLTSACVLVWPADPYKNYLIVYRRLADEIEIARVLHGARAKVWRQTFS